MRYFSASKIDVIVHSLEKGWKKYSGLTYNTRLKTSQKPVKHDFSIYSEQEAYAQGGNYLRMEMGSESEVSIC